MNILVLGAAGFIGSACFDYFSQSHNVMGVDVKKTNENIIIDIDGSKTRELIASKKLDLIINCAGSANIPRSFEDPKNDFKINTVFVQNILSVLKEQSPETKFINISSAAVYGNPDATPVNENSITAPISPYGSHKLLTEQLMLEYNKVFSLKTLSVRIFSAYGNGLRQQLFFDLFKKLQKNPETCELYGTGHESRDFIHITDIVSAFDILSTRGQFNGEIYNLGSGVETKINNVVNLFCNLADYKGKITFSMEQKAGYPINWQADIRKISAVGFIPKMQLDEGLKQYIAWLQSPAGE